MTDWLPGMTDRLPGVTVRLILSGFVSLRGQRRIRWGKCLYALPASPRVLHVLLSCRPRYVAGSHRQRLPCSGSSCTATRTTHIFGYYV